jgi:hypothetical protein
MSDSSKPPDGGNRKSLRDLKRVANQNADMHSWEHDRYNRWSQLLISGGLVFSAFLLVLSLSSTDFIHRTLGISPDLYTWLLALLAFLSFSVTLIVLAWQPAAKAGSHKRSISHYVRVKHRIDQMIDQKEPPTNDEVQSLWNDYLDDDDLPKISNRRFNSLKRRHLIKVAVSRELSANPHRSIRAIRRSLSQKESEHAAKSAS